MNPRTMDFSPRIGGYSYRQAKADLGCPNFDYDENGRTTAEWLLMESLPPSFDLGFECRYTPPERGKYGGLLRLEFDRNGELTAWNRVEYGFEPLERAWRTGALSGPVDP